MLHTEVVVAHVSRSHSIARLVMVGAVLIWIAVLGTRAAVVAGQAPAPASPAPVMPQYDGNRNLRLQGWRYRRTVAAEQDAEAEAVVPHYQSRGAGAVLFDGERGRPHLPFPSGLLGPEGDAGA